MKESRKAREEERGAERRITISWAVGQRPPCPKLTAGQKQSSERGEAEENKHRKNQTKTTGSLSYGVLEP